MFINSSCSDRFIVSYLLDVQQGSTCCYGSVLLGVGEGGGGRQTAV